MEGTAKTLFRIFQNTHLFSASNSAQKVSYIRDTVHGKLSSAPNLITRVNIKVSVRIR